MKVLNGVTVGDYPQVSALIKGVFNERPPQPRFQFIWDVQVVFDYLKKLSIEQTCLSDRFLSWKTGMAVIALTSATRSSGIHLLGTEYMEV